MEINPNIKVIDYDRTKKDVNIECLKCGFIGSVKYKKLLMQDGCPHCNEIKLDIQNNNNRIKSEKSFFENMAVKHPDIIIVGDYKNATTKLAIKCRVCGKEWETTPNSLEKGQGCPSCVKRHINRVNKGINDLATVNPGLASEWHPIKNGDLTPYDVCIHSDRKVWWLCKEGHEWEAMINNRSKNQGCPFCSGRKRITGVNDFATEKPELLKEWNYEKNSIRPTDIASGSHEKVWWICNQGHEWKAEVRLRVRGNGNCPICRHSIR